MASLPIYISKDAQSVKVFPHRWKISSTSLDLTSDKQSSFLHFSPDFLYLITVFSNHHKQLSARKCRNNSENPDFSSVIGYRSVSFPFLLYTGRQTNKMCGAKSAWRWDTGPTNAQGSGNMCTDRQEQLR